MDEKIIQILKKVQKPARYVGGELCMPVVNPEPRVKFCLCTPELYEDSVCDVLGQTTYYLLNDRKGYACERCFAPAIDMGRELRKASCPLFSLENQIPLSDFDVLNFNFKSEMEYTTFLYMLFLAGIPLESNQRTKNHPFVFATGIVSSNPEPIADFVDFAIIGDTEDVVVKVVDTILKAKLSKLSREETINRLSLLPGVYVPSKIKFEFSKDGKIAKIVGDPVKRQVLRDIDRTYFPTRIIVPNIKSRFENGMVEVMRGCTRSCRFCQAGFVSRPARERRVQTLVAQANAQIFQSGVDSICLSSPFPDDFSKLSELEDFMSNLCDEKNKKYNLLTTNQETFKPKVTCFAGKNAFMISPEAGSEKLRKIINKQLSNEEILSKCEKAFKEGTTLVKLNFMIGLPFETAEDLLSIVDLVLKIKEKYKVSRGSKKPLNVGVSIETFIPKPNTPFQWCAFVGKKEIEKRQKFLEIAFKKMGVKLSFRDSENSEIEAILSRADRRVCPLLKKAFSLGAIFDFDEELFNKKAFEDAISLLNFDKEKYLDKFGEKDILPQDKIEFGVDKNFLFSELKKASNGELTNDCKHGCNGCGLAKMGVCANGRC